MHRTSIAVLGLSLMTLPALAGCDDANRALASGGEGGSGQGGGLGSGGAHGVTCSSRPSETPLACDGIACAVTFDMTVSCDDAEFASAGVRVAAATGTTYVAASSNARAHLFFVGAEGADSVEGFDLHARPIAVATAPDGKLVVAGVESAGDAHGDGALTALVGTPGALTRVQLSSAQQPADYTDVGVAPDGTPFVWFEAQTAGQDEAFFASSIAPDGTATRRPAPFRDLSGWNRFALATDGATISYDIEVLQATAPSRYQLVTREGDVDVDVSLSAPLLGGDRDSFDFRPIAAPSDVSAEAVRYAVILQDGGAGLRVSWPAGASYVDAALPGSASFAPTCVSGAFPGEDGACPAPCHETGSGVEWRSFSAARVVGDTVVAAYVVTRHDDHVAYVLASPTGVGTTCEARTKDAHVTHELVVVRQALAAGEPAVEVLRAPFAGLEGFGAWFPLEGEPLLDVAAVGSDVAIALRVSDANDQPTVRVVRLSLPPAGA